LGVLKVQSPALDGAYFDEQALARVGRPMERTAALRQQV
jgi:hypothetical protein